jgi:NAD(P)H-dependent FMN reductase
MHVLAFAATTSRRSINRALIDYATRLLEARGDDITVEILDLNDYEMPIYSADRQLDDGIPAAAHDFYRRIGAADALLISFAEHNGFYTAAYKNVFDWVSRIDMRVFQGRPTVMLSTSPGRNGGANVLRTAVQSAPFFGNEVLASLAIPNFSANFDTVSGSITDPELDEQLRAAIFRLNTDSLEAAT